MDETLPEIKPSEYVLEHTERKLKYVHDPSLCEGRPCTVHNLTDHKMRSFYQSWRSDRKIMERICPHGVGHPDPDDYKIFTGADDNTHGCDGCCAGSYYSLTLP